MRLEKRVAVITGASRGIGRAIAVAMAAEGARVAALARSAGEIDDLAAAIRKDGGETIAVPCDVSSEADVAAAVEETLSAFGQIDILVNNAAINHPNTELADMDPATWRSVLDVNLTGPFLCARAVLPHMRERASGRIINISSIGGRRGAARRGAYRATKAGLINMTETLAAENRRYGVDVNCVCPGAVATDMMRVVDSGRAAASMMAPEEIASVVVWLASAESTAITGTSIDAYGQSNPLFA